MIDSVDDAFVLGDIADGRRVRVIWRDELWVEELQFGYGLTYPHSFIRSESES